MLNGNVGVMKSLLVELTDETNLARGYSLIAVTCTVGYTIGSDTSFDSFLLALMANIGHVGPSLVVCYLGHKTVGQLCSQILSGANIHTSCLVLPQLHMLSCHHFWLYYF